MSISGEDLYAALDAAIARWNAQMAAIPPSLTDQMISVKESLLEIRRFLANRRTLSSGLVTARAQLSALENYQKGQVPQVEEAIAQVTRLEEAFTAFIGGLKQFDDTAKTLLECFNTLYPEQSSRVARQEAPVEIPDLLEATAQSFSFEEAARVSPAASAPVSASPAPPQSEEKRLMGAILIEAGVITRPQLEHALREQRSSWNRHLGAILVELGFANEETIAQALAAQSRLTFVRLSEQEINRSAIRMVPERLAELHTCMPLRLYGNTLRVAMANPYDLIAIEDLRLAANRRIDPVVATAGDIRAAVRLWYAKLI